jgi:hypothetical protein
VLPREKLSGGTWPSISADGHTITFFSLSDDLVQGDTNGAFDVFAHMECGATGTDFCAANVNSTGAPASSAALCSGSSSAGDLQLAAGPVPNQFGIFFHGMNQTQVVFGNGYLCIVDDIVRGAVVHGFSHFASYAYDNSDATHSLAAFIGSTRYFQYWFRDPMGGGAFFNTSNAVSLAILP